MNPAIHQRVWEARWRTVPRQKPADTSEVCDAECTDKAARVRWQPVFNEARRLDVGLVYLAAPDAVTITFRRNKRGEPALMYTKPATALRALAIHERINKR